MLQSELIALVRDLVDDSNDVPYIVSDAVMAGYVDEAEREAAERSLYLTLDSTYNINVLPGIATYQLSPAIIQLTRAKLLGELHPLMQTSQQELDFNINGWEYLGEIQPALVNLSIGGEYVITNPGTVNWLSLGASSYAAGTVFTYNGGAVTGGMGFCIPTSPVSLPKFYISGKASITLYPKPNSAYTLILDGVRRPTTSMETPVELHESLSHWVMYKWFNSKYEDRYKPKEAMIHLAMFTKIFGVKRSAQYVNNLQTKSNGAPLRRNPFR
jgi:hypothetical protein